MFGKGSYLQPYLEAVKVILQNESAIADLRKNNVTAVNDNLMDDHKNLFLNLDLYQNLTKVLFADSSEKESYLHILESYSTRKELFEAPVVIVAGGAALMDKAKTETYRDYFRKMMHGFTGTIISGGTTDGIPGLVGEVKSELEEYSKLNFNLVAYLPEKLPLNVAKSKAYDIFCETDSDHFSVQEILNYWCDLVCSGIHPSEVVLVGINGGKIAAMEYRIALSLGAKVKILANSGRAANELLEDKYWKTHQNLSEVMPD